MAAPVEVNEKGVEGESIWERVKNGQTVFHFHFFQPIYYLTLQSVSPGLPSFGTVCNDENRFDFPEEWQSDFLVLSNCRRFKIINEQFTRAVQVVMNLPHSFT